MAKKVLKVVADPDEIRKSIKIGNLEGFSVGILAEWGRRANWKGDYLPENWNDMHKTFLWEVPKSTFLEKGDI